MFPFALQNIPSVFEILQITIELIHRTQLKGGHYQIWTYAMRMKGNNVFKMRMIWQSNT